MTFLHSQIRNLVKGWVSVSPSRHLIVQAAWEQKHSLLQVLVVGIIAAGLEGATFALLAVALELLATSRTLDVDRLTAYGFGWISTWSSGRQFVVLVVAAVICQVGKSVSQILNTQISGLLSAQAAQKVQQKTLGIILDMNFSTASRHKVGELTNYVMVPAESVSTILIQALDSFTSCLTILAYVAVLCVISLPLFIAALFLFGAVVWLQKIVGRKIGNLSHIMGVQQADLSRKVVEGISGLRLIHAFHRQNLIKHQVEVMQNRFIQTMRQLNIRLALLGPLSDSLLLVGLGGFLLVGFFLFKNDRSSLLPDLLTFVAVLNRLSNRISQLGIGISRLHAFIGRLRILNEILGTCPNEMLRTGGEKFKNFTEAIRFESVSLQYPSREEYALCNIQLKLEKGNSLALVGPSGSGKSSLADLLLGLYEPNFGKITVDGKDLRDLDIGSWRKILGVVSQDTLLFNTTVKENLSFANPEASEAEMLDALRAAEALDFIEKLPKGIETLIGERGFMLSGGQRQRLAIARALLRKPAILILDEATSALDTNSEQAVQKTIDSLTSTGTRLIIAHRLSTIRAANKIAVLDQGCIVEYGTHEELMEKNGLYTDLWRKQSGMDEK